jgi:ABC-type ATPase involved in cell division
LVLATHSEALATQRRYRRIHLVDGEVVAEKVRPA